MDFFTSLRQNTRLVPVVMNLEASGNPRLSESGGASTYKASSARQIASEDKFLP